ncbi:hypothetical protein [Roseateles puraquae]|uniref:hypothetical protein n=1 Tax=Roseateles puraquae TaxID=431059 RepID=UPI0031E0231F
METTILNTPIRELPRLVRPFKPLTLQRPMVLFPKSLGLQAGVASTPSDEFLATLLLGRKTYLAALRSVFGVEFKNFQNYASQRVRTTTETRNRLLAAVNGDVELLDLLARVLRRDPKAGDLATLVRIAEGLVSTLMRQMLSASLRCPNCRTELISRPIRWWGKQPCRLGPQERKFVDRVLQGVLVSTLFPLFFANWETKGKAVHRLAALCEPDGHPFKNWLNEVRKPYRAKDLTALAARAGLEGEWAPESLQRMSRGEMLTAEMIEEVTARVPTRKAELRALGMQARALAFVVDFMRAADTTDQPVDQATAQMIVGARLKQLVEDLRLSVVAERGHVLQAANMASEGPPGRQPTE